MESQFLQLQPRIIKCVNECHHSNIDPTDAGILIADLTQLLEQVLKQQPITNPIYNDDVSVLMSCRKRYVESYDASCRAMDTGNWEEQQLQTFRNNQRICIPHIMTRYDYYNQDKVKKMLLQIQAAQGEITVTMTSCKRFKLFCSTVNSFLNACQDLHLIREWIVVDDNSSHQDREEMKKLYPFIKWVFKTPSQRGHAISMNILQKMVTTPYVWHQEDDWLWIRSTTWLSNCYQILKSNTKLGQCLVNKNYGEAEETMMIFGGHLVNPTSSTPRHYIHEYYQGEELKTHQQNNQNVATCSYWPHYSLRVGLQLTKIWTQLGEYNDLADHFEMEYANRYIKAGWKTAFLDNLACCHIGRLTSQRNDNQLLNAYNLNNCSQFQTCDRIEVIDDDEKMEIINPPLNRILQLTPQEQLVPESGFKEYTIKTYVINLKRRPDRLKKFVKLNHTKLTEYDYNIFQACDGKTINMTPAMLKLFETGDYNYRSGIIGCAASHIKIWCELIIRKEIDCFMVIEDDAVLGEDFNNRVKQALRRCTENWDILWLGHFLYPEFATSNELPHVELWSREKAIQRNMGGTFAYIITRQGAEKMLNHIHKSGVYNAIDWVMFKNPDINQNYVVPHIVTSECASLVGVDSDIQHDNSSQCKSIESRMVQEIKYWLKPDDFGVDYHNITPEFTGVVQNSQSRIKVMNVIPKRSTLLLNICMINIEKLTTTTIDMLKKYPIIQYNVESKWLITIPTTIFQQENLKDVALGGYFNIYSWCEKEMVANL